MGAVGKQDKILLKQLREYFAEMKGLRRSKLENSRNSAKLKTEVIDNISRQSLDFK